MSAPDRACDVETLARREVLLSILFAGAAASTFALLPRLKIDYLGTRKLADLIPARIGAWRFMTSSGLVVPPEDALSDQLYGEVLTRVYSDDTHSPIMLLIAQNSGQTGFLQIHRPEFCYPAAGFTLSPMTRRNLAANGAVMTVNATTATAPGRVEQMLYWTRIGNEMPQSWAKQKLAVAMDNLQGYVPDAVLVRVSTIDPDEAAALTRLASFVEAMLGAMPGRSSEVLVGKL